MLLKACSMEPADTAGVARMLDEGAGCISSIELVVKSETEADMDSNAEMTSFDDAPSRLVGVWMIEENLALSGAATSGAALDEVSATLELEVWPSATGVAAIEEDIGACALEVVAETARVDVDMLTTLNDEPLNALE